jgi:hypothetical protein
MFLKQYQFRNPTKNVYYIFKRNYNFKKLSIEMEKNPYVKSIIEEQSKKNEQQGVLKKLIDKR